MKYKFIYLISIAFLWTLYELSIANETLRNDRLLFFHKLQHSSDLKKIILRRNSSISTENSIVEQRTLQADEIKNTLDSPVQTCREPSFGDVIKRCVSERRSKIIENFTRGKMIITHCFKAAVIFSFFKYLTMSPNSKIKLFKGVVEFVKISDRLHCNEFSECKETNSWFNEVSLKNDSDKNEYLYDRVVEKVVDADKENVDIRAENLVKNANDDASKNFFWKIITNLLVEKSEKEEEERLKKELTDKKTLAALDALSRIYVLKINAFSGITIKMQRNLNGEISFNVEESPELADSIAETKNEHSVTVGYAAPRELQRTGNNKNKKKVGKNKKTWQKHLKNLILPFSIQIAILPFFLKNLLFFAVKALLAGKLAMTLLAFNVIRNAKLQDENYLTRVEHYGYKGEEYGAWINGRKFNVGSQNYK